MDTEDRIVYWDDQEILNRLRRIEGQIRGVQQLVLKHETCRAILTQLSAVEGALRQVSRIVQTCSVAEALVEEAQFTEVDVSQIRETLKKVLKS
ncbi:hypothetical protein TPY_3329 [Sulfobacillus acidophilus TPY]|uniref:Metal-sensitive transcriptional regulator n=1 Tax=Sulfobacillus acidophilus (strain ATCC 700253 / DSM 10332 / NAL) TaxID=679936 RepID=G8TYB5_SULAD|nr:hypothetical protein TPY_3329 [Sulfobacillus acidophilus TPY]AEW05079.1 protein of unknown function DUF156 [Sulfobacillus acidophilus DSM 10332]MCY0864764.1 metal-sensitive transcriptional regulator [Sulfobacillus sp.]